MILDEFKIPGKNLKVSATLKVESEQLSGNTSSTTQAHTGYKPIKISVYLLLPYEKHNDLRRLIAVAETLGEDDSPKIYSIVDLTANSMGVQQVKFNGDFRVRAQARLNAWRISFSLIEYLSVPEKKEQRQATQAATPTLAPGEQVAAANNDATDESLTGFEQVLDIVNKAIGP